MKKAFLVAVALLLFSTENVMALDKGIAGELSGEVYDFEIYPRCSLDVPDYTKITIRESVGTFKTYLFLGILTGPENVIQKGVCHKFNFNENKVLLGVKSCYSK